MSDPNESWAGQPPGPASKDPAEGKRDRADGGQAAMVADPPGPAGKEPAEGSRKTVDDELARRGSVRRGREGARAALATVDDGDGLSKGNGRPAGPEAMRDPPSHWDKV